MDEIGPESQEPQESQDMLDNVLEATQDDLVSSLREVLPPEWLQEQAELVIGEVVPYMAGDTDSFAITILVADRLEILGDVLKRELDSGDTYDLIFDDVIAPELQEWLEDERTGGLPFGANIASQDIVEAVREVLPPEWARERVEHVVDQVVPYLTGEADRFAIQLPVADRIEAAVPAVKRLIRDADAYNLIFDKVIVTLVEKEIGTGKQLPLGITVTADEIVPALREVLPPEFIQEQAERMIDEFVPYLIGDAQGFKIVVPLADRKEAALGVIEELAERKLEELAATLPQCTVEEAVDLVQGGFTGGLPGCMPTGYTLEEIKQALGIQVTGITVEEIEQQRGIDLTIVTEGVTLDRVKESFGIDVVGEVSSIIGDALPDEFVYTDADLRETLGVADEERLDDALDSVRNGFTYTDADLRGDLGVEDEETLDDVLEGMREGFTFTDTDLRDGISDDGGANQDLDRFDEVRDRLGLGRSLWFLLYLVPGLFLASIGFLGGRRWRSRLAWTAVVLGIGTGIAYAAAGPVYTGFVGSILDDELAELSSGETGVALVVALKSVTIVKAVSDDVVSGLANRALLFLIISVSAVALAIVWPLLTRLIRGSVKEEP